MSTTGPHLSLTREVERPRVVPELPGGAYSQRWALRAQKHRVALLGRASGPRTPGMSTTGPHLSLTREVEALVLCRSFQGGAYSQRWALRAQKNRVALLGRASGPLIPRMSTTGPHLSPTREVERPRVVPKLPGVAYSQRWALRARKNCVALLGRASGPRTPRMSTT